MKTYIPENLSNLSDGIFCSNCNIDGDSRIFDIPEGNVGVGIVGVVTTGVVAPGIVGVVTAGIVGVVASVGTVGSTTSGMSEILSRILNDVKALRNILWPI